MKNVLIFLLLPLFSLSQTYTTSLIDTLPSSISEASGLLHINGKLITINDSENDAFLFELDKTTGNSTRKVFVKNATNSDWEALAQSNDYIFIGDIGNNAGMRTNLQIYRVLKIDFLQNDTVFADTITYIYEDHPLVPQPPNGHNWDAEAMVFKNDSLFIFTKNWSNSKTNLYKLPAKTGNHIAQKVDSLNTQFLVTGADIKQSQILLTGYNLQGTYLMSIDGEISQGFNSVTIYTHNLVLANSGLIEGIAINDSIFFCSEDILNQRGSLYYLGNIMGMNELQHNLFFYPSPSNGKLRINSTFNWLKVYDLKGNNISFSYIGDTIHIKQKGVFILLFSINGSIYKQKIKVK